MHEERTSRRDFVKRMAVTATTAAPFVGTALTVNAETEDRGTGKPRLYHETEEWRKYYDTLK
ncbi:MAG: hypothetical protein A3K19_25215 [Lentisphaerae bacterium RIFOXYB12_FULL_65_16]|nr:MAG: hypothetical protein A3K18_06660 [Lentisphaerae bacterium RIFOXYA12_64_32]OGV91122.1 MAG: hypothetical protein A3K19_25215 [Lentisphaerae bacterium RIFOXYB12_FULL_65_16]